MTDLALASAAVLGAIALAGVVYQWLGAHWARKWLDPKDGCGAETLPSPPLTLLRPLKAGTPAVRGKLEMLVQAMRPGDQLVIGACPGSVEEAASLSVQAQFPAAEITVVACRPDAARNPKISKLAQMEAQCRHDHWLLSDSETIIDRAWLEGFRQEWAASGAKALTAPYRFTGLVSWAQRLDAAAALLTLWPGLAITRRLGRVNFTLGACTALHRSDVQTLGGWSAWGEFLAEDNRLGAALGRGIRLSQHVVTVDGDLLTWQDYWRHQRRLAVTYRVCDPRGFAAQALTHTSTATLLLAIFSPGGATARPEWLLFAFGCHAARWAAAVLLARRLRFPIRGLWLMMAPAGLAETAAWLQSWVSPRVWWGGRRFRVCPAGRLSLDAAT